MCQRPLNRHWRKRLQSKMCQSWQWSPGRPHNSAVFQLDHWWSKNKPLHPYQRLPAISSRKRGNRWLGPTQLHARNYASANWMRHVHWNKTVSHVSHTWHTHFCLGNVGIARDTRRNIAYSTGYSVWIRCPIFWPFCRCIQWSREWCDKCLLWEIRKRLFPSDIWSGMKKTAFLIGIQKWVEFFGKFTLSCVLSHGSMWRMALYLCWMSSTTWRMWQPTPFHPVQKWRINPRRNQTRYRPVGKMSEESKNEKEKKRNLFRLGKCEIRSSSRHFDYYYQYPGRINPTWKYETSRGRSISLKLQAANRHSNPVDWSLQFCLNMNGSHMTPSWKVQKATEEKLLNFILYDTSWMYAIF